MTFKLNKVINIDYSKDYSSLPHKQGIYLFFNEDLECFYIGKAKDIKRRVKEHIYTGFIFEDEFGLTDDDEDRVDMKYPIYVAFFLVKKVNELNTAEKYVINLFKSKNNIQYNKS